MRLLQISELEELSGVPRQVVYFYVRRGLLPVAQKASATRAIYTDEHLALLQEITALKEEGLSIKQIKRRLAPHIQQAGATEVDLATEQLQQRREAILHEAARQFAEKGYDRTRISDIVQALGIAPQALYDFFPTKHHLFVACYNVYVDWMREQIEPHAQAETDLASRRAWRMYANLGIRALSPELQALAQIESLREKGDELRTLIRDTWRSVLAPMIQDLATVRSQDETPAFLSDELVAFGLVGAFGTMLMRASWDDKYTAKDAMQNMMAIDMAIEAVYEGRLDISQSMAGAAGLVDYLSKLPPPGLPPRPASSGTSTGGLHAHNNDRS